MAWDTAFPTKVWWKGEQPALCGREKPKFKVVTLLAKEGGVWRGTYWVTTLMKLISTLLFLSAFSNVQSGEGQGEDMREKGGTQCFGGGTNVGVTFDRIGKFSKFRMLEGEPPPSPSPEMSLWSSLITEIGRHCFSTFKSLEWSCLIQMCY